MDVDGLAIPELLVEMLAAGRWPSDERAAQMQNLRPLCLPDRVRRLAEEESFVYLDAPPFRSVARRLKHGEDFWGWELAVSDGLVFSRTIPIADFGLGSDAPIVLDYRDSTENPTILRLRYGPRRKNQWLPMAPTFEHFVRELGL